MQKELFIGRESELRRFRKDFFFAGPDSYGHCYSLVGLNGIGKTALIRHLSEEFEADPPANTFYFATIIEDGMTFWSFWADLLEQFSEIIDEEYLSSLAPQPTRTQAAAIRKITDAYQYIKTNMTNLASEDVRSYLMKHLDIFKYYTALGVRILITIDEFDRAEKVFKTGQFFQRLYDLAPKGVAKVLNLSIITISRRRAYTIAHDMQEGSNFESAYPPYILKGFTDQELQEYFDTYRELPCGLLPEDAQKQVLYLCGRSPGLLMEMRHEFEFVEKQDLDIGSVYAEHGQFIKTAYSRMISLMEKSFTDREQQKPLLDVFIQAFVGPAYDDNFDVEMSLLYDHGFVTMDDAGNGIFAYSGIKLQQNGGKEGDQAVYGPIAPYFIEYIKQNVLPYGIFGLTGMLTKAEQLVREVIEKEMRAAFPNTWEDIVNNYAEKKDIYLETLQLRALQNDFVSSSISKLNVISFKEYYYIIKDHWDLFSKYFTGYPSKNALFSAMSMLSDSRNDSAHLNLVVYNGENKRKLRETCSFFISCLERGPVSSEDENNELPTEEQIDLLVGGSAVITFCCQAIKMPKGNLRGIIKEYSFPAGVAQRKLDAFGFTSEPQVGDEFTAVVERWDSNAKMFNLRAPY